jgi:hypothetical protein
LRTRGDYEKILVNIERELNNDKRNKKLDTYLHLSKTLALGELNDMDKMFISLDEAQETSKKILRTDCLLAKATLSLRLAEQIPLDGTDQKPLREIWTALNLHAKNASADLMAVVFGTAVPVTWTFLLDAYGYSLLKAGHKKFSKSFLTYCIIEDPGFSSPYLHLGEWYKIDAMTESNSTDIEKNERSHRLATLCFQLALKLEGNKDSLIRRRAQSLLDQQKKSGK